MFIAPCVGFVNKRRRNAQVQYKQVSFTCWDVGGKDKIRPLWRHYFTGTKGIIFVVDSNDRERFNDARIELDTMLQEEQLSDGVLLVFANKQDLPGSASVAEITDALGLHKLRGRRWYIQACCATSGDGLYEGLDWLCGTIWPPRTASPPRNPEKRTAGGFSAGDMTKPLIPQGCQRSTARGFSHDMVTGRPEQAPGLPRASATKQASATIAPALCGTSAAIAALRTRSFACVELDPSAAVAVEAALLAASMRLRRARAVAKKDDTVTTKTGSTLVCGTVECSEAHWAHARSQLRLVQTAADSEVVSLRPNLYPAVTVGHSTATADAASVEDEAVEAMCAAWQALAIVGEGCLGASVEALLGASVLDAFYYAPFGGSDACASGTDNANACKGCAWACAPHTDASVLTLVVADTDEGLQCRDTRSGEWVDVPLGRGKCAVLLGRAAATTPPSTGSGPGLRGEHHCFLGGAACEHRVLRPADPQTLRTSLTLDLYMPGPKARKQPAL